MLSINNLTVKLSNKVILDNLNFKLSDGEVVSLLGANGSGKTTLLSIISNPSFRVRDKIFLKKQDISQQPANELAKDIVCISQNLEQTLFMEMSVRENIKLYSGLSNISTDFILELEKKFEYNLSSIIKQKVCTLSGGQKQVLALILIMLKEPKVLLLDEHTSALDHESAIKVMGLTKRVVKSRGIAVLMVTHHIELARSFSDKLAILSNGSIRRIFSRIEDRAIGDILKEF